MHSEEKEIYTESEARMPDPPDGDMSAVAGDVSSEGATESVAEDSAKSGHNRHAIREIVETVLITLLIFLVVRALVQNFRVDGDSMLPTLHSDEYLLVNKGLYFRYDANFLARIFNPGVPADMHYLFHGPQRGDIVVFASPVEPKDFIKRVIATEGETVEVKRDPNGEGLPGEDCGDCGVYVNGAKLDEPYVKATPNYAVDPIVVPPGQVYVLGDNRRDSSDSHIWGALPVENIIGAAFLSYWPTSEWGLLPHPTYAEKK
jgi:signal peptidase I